MKKKELFWNITPSSTFSFLRCHKIPPKIVGPPQFVWPQCDHLIEKYAEKSPSYCDVTWWIRLQMGPFLCFHKGPHPPFPGNITIVADKHAYTKKNTHKHVILLPVQYKLPPNSPPLILAPSCLQKLTSTCNFHRPIKFKTDRLRYAASGAHFSRNSSEMLICTGLSLNSHFWSVKDNNYKQNLRKISTGTVLKFPVDTLLSCVPRLLHQIYINCP